MIFLIFIVWVAGVLLGVYLKDYSEPDCPRAVLGYNCMGDWCDHDKSTLYTNMATMAKNEEARQNETL